MLKINTKELLSEGLSGFTLKMIAITAMFIDHVSYLGVPSGSDFEWIIRFIGRTAAPVMCFLIAEGYHHTSDKKRYFYRLLLFSALSHIPYVVYFDLPFFRATSVIWSLAMGLFALTGVKNKHFPMLLKVATVILSCLLAYNANWNYIAVLWIVNFGLYRNDFKKQIIGYSLIGLLFYIIQGLIRVGPHVGYRIGIFVPLLFIYLYNGKQGKKTKWAKWSFYIFYPLHLIVLYFLKLYIF